MKIRILSPCLTRETSKEQEERIKRRNKAFQKILGNDVEIDSRGLDTGSANIESFFDEYVGGPSLIKNAMEAEKDGIDAVVLGCAGDPLIDGLREVLNIPVIGPMEASLHLACIIGHKFTWLTPGKFMISRKRKSIENSGLRNNLASVRDLGLSVAGLHENPKKSIDIIIKVIEDAIEKDGAEVIILGCLGMTEFAEEISKRVDIPVIEPLSIGLKLAESMVRLGLKHSKVSYPKPREKKRIF